MQGRPLPKHSDKAVNAAAPIESKGLRKPKIAPDDEVILTDASQDFVQEEEGKKAIITVDGTPVPTSEQEIMDLDNEQEEEIYKPSKFDKVSQKMLDALREAFNLDPTGESYTVVVAVTTSNGKIYNIKADSTEDQRFKDVEVWGKAFVEAEVTKTMTAFGKKEEDRQRGKQLLTKRSPI